MVPRNFTKEDLELLQRNITLEFPFFTIVKKDQSPFMKLIGFVLLCITFGKMRTFMTTFTTTVGYTVYVPNDWESRPEPSRAITLRHERAHMRQRRERGMFTFTFLYLFVLPAVRAFYRARFEQEAYEESLRAMVEYYGEGSLASNRDRIVGHFTSSEYFWMWAKRVDIEKWYDAAAAKALARQ